MAIRFIIFSLATFGFWNCYAQKQYWNWHFAQNSILDFSTTPATHRGGSGAAQLDGGASISDSSGQLLFYCANGKILNRNGESMPKAGQITAGILATQSSLIFPNPVLDSLFYVVTLDESSDDAGARYSQVNMTKENGLGDVTRVNVDLFTPCAEKVVGVRSTGFCGYWAILHEMESNNFRVYKVTVDGIEEPEKDIAVQSIGNVLSHDQNFGEAGQMKLSQDGKKLAMVNRSINGVELFDFDPETGEITNARTWDIGNTRLYGVEFGLNGNVLFASATTRIYKTAIHGSATDESIASFSTTITSTGWPGYFQGMHLAPDGNIWICRQDQNYFSWLVDNDSYADVSFVSTGLSTLSSGGQLVRNTMNDFVVGLDWDLPDQCLGVEPTIYDRVLKFYHYVSPNADGHNDEFWIDNIQYYPTSVLDVFNTLGEKIYSKKGYDNTWSPDHLDAGTYRYQLTLEEGSVHNGKFTLVN